MRGVALGQFANENTIADADLNQAILQGTTRREPTIDFQTANGAGLPGLNDPEVKEMESWKNLFGWVSIILASCPNSLATFVA